jgi:hypothetical protein
MEEKTVRIQFSPETLRIRGILPEILQGYYTDLAIILGGKFQIVVPTNISGTHELDMVLELHEIMTTLKDIQGFNRHISNFTVGQIQATLFVSRVAYYLFDKVSEVELEPICEESSGNPDIRINSGDQDIYLECKMLETSQFTNYEEQKEYADQLFSLIDFPHQITIHYKDKPSKSELENLGKNINGMLKHVTNDGNIITNSHFQVNVILRNYYNSKIIFSVLEMTMEDISTGNKMPGHVFYGQRENHRFVWSRNKFFKDY